MTPNLREDDLLLRLKGIGFENVDAKLDRFVIRSAGCQVGSALSWHEASIICRWLKALAGEPSPPTLSEMYGEARLWR